MPIITVDINNLETEHICCAISEKKGENCVGSKKAWLRQRMEYGLVFKKLDERGKVFIEYIPAEYAFAPVDAPGYMYINCFWVSGKYKGQGYANELLQACIDDAKAKGCKGLVTLSSDKKSTFLSDPKYLKYKGFTLADSAEPYFELLYLPFDENAQKPSFRPQVKTGKIDEGGLVLYYSNGCPHTDKYVKIIQEHAQSQGKQLSVRKIETLEQAKSSPTPFTIYSLYKDGEFVTNEILTTKKFDELTE
ncbi:MAG: N-acetyltransferase [Eubacteriales bacterium]